MVDLLGRYSLQDIIIFIIVLALAIKGCVSFFDWLSKTVRAAVHKAQTPERLKDDIQNHTEDIEKLEKSLTQITDLVHMLIESDKDDIKAFITREHHYFCYQKGWIDDYSLDCIEKRFMHYKDQGGNSFIHDLIKEIRKLPKQPPKDND